MQSGPAKMVTVMLVGLEFDTELAWARVLALSAARIGSARERLYMAELELFVNVWRLRVNFET